MTISLAGTGMAQGQLAVTPTTTDFGNVTVGTSKTQAGALSASGSSVSISSATLTSAEFSLSGITFPLTIAVGQSVPFTVTFTPQMSGSTSAISSFASNASNSAAETLTGTGAAAAAQRGSLLEGDFHRCRLQRLPRDSIGRALRENQFCT